MKNRKKRLILFITVAAAVAVTAAGVGIGLAIHNSRRIDTGEPAPPETTAHVHSYTAEVVEATCGHAGYTLHSCDCGDSYRDAEVDPLPHEYGEWVVTIEATVENEGQQEKHCLHCNERIIEAIPQLEEHVHTYEDTVHQPTCTEKGVTLHTCTGCGYAFADTETAATGHSWSSWKETRSATTSEAGEKVRTCRACGETVTESIPKIVETHTHSYTEKVVEPTCTKKGYTLYSCECGESYKDDYVSAAGHLYGSWETTKKPTTTKEGEKQCVCSRCSDILTETVDKLDEKTAELYESYIDPRIEVVDCGSGVIAYCYPSLQVADFRSWGTPPTIRITEEGGFAVTYYKQDGTKVSCSIIPVEGYASRLAILEDGSYSTRLLGDFKD